MAQQVLTRPMGRPEIGPIVAFRVPPEYKAAVEEEAKRRGVPAAQIWREIMLSHWDGEG